MKIIYYIFESNKNKCAVGTKHLEVYRVVKRVMCNVTKKATFEKSGSCCKKRRLFQGCANRSRARCIGNAKSFERALDSTQNPK